MSELSFGLSRALRPAGECHRLVSKPGPPSLKSGQTTDGNPLFPTPVAFAIRGSAGFQTCSIAGFQAGKAYEIAHDGKSSNGPQVWKSAVQTWSCAPVGAVLGYVLSGRLRRHDTCVDFCDQKSDQFNRLGHAIKVRSALRPRGKPRSDPDTSRHRLAEKPALRLRIGLPTGCHWLNSR